MIKLSDKIYSNEYGYFLKEDNEWTFIASDKPLTASHIQYILETIKDLNHEIH